MINLQNALREGPTAAGKDSKDSAGKESLDHVCRTVVNGVCGGVVSGVSGVAAAGMTAGMRIRASCSTGACPHRILTFQPNALTASHRLRHRWALAIHRRDVAVAESFDLDAA
eukprot:2677068-Prymnesium_polylepis.2